ncbi:unnamed protein product [Arctogadus glacialis]
MFSQKGGSGGRTENLIWQAKLFLLPGPDSDLLPQTKTLDELAKLGSGKPVQDSADSRTNSKIGLNWSLAELNGFVCHSYPHISLNLVGFELARTGKGRKIKILNVSSVRELKTAVGKSRLYIVPRATVLQETSAPSAMSQNPFPPLSGAPAADETSQVASTSSAISMDSFPPLSIVQYETAPLAEREGDEDTYQACEERRQKTLFDFVGQDDGASEFFGVQEATSSRSIESSSAGSMIDHGIKPSSTLYVLWFSNQHLQSEPSTQPSLPVPSTHSLLSEPSLQPLPSENSIQPSLPLISQPQEILTDEEPSLPPSPSLEPIIHPDEQEETVSQNQSPVSTNHHGGPVDEIDLQTILKKLVSKVDDRFSPTTNQINVSRDNLLQCSLRAFKLKVFRP